ncbi:MAG TPA: hypothetical protein VH186_06475 [Chloroflexia bacterium]|nr:hypothetical protein [Chloroflexia bacterium]
MTGVIRWFTGQTNQSTSHYISDWALTCQREEDEAQVEALREWRLKNEAKKAAQTSKKNRLKSLH